MTPPSMHVEDGAVIAHEPVGASYRILTLGLPTIAALARSGQFVHLRLAMLQDAVLRRPFSIYRVGGGQLSILYKSVGRGTAAMKALLPGTVLSVIGPLGNGFPAPGASSIPVCVTGGYGIAPLSFFARQSGRRGVLFAGGAGGHDILCIEDFKALGWEIHVATEDGSIGTRGLVTAPLDAWLAGQQGKTLEFFACGPNGLLKAVGERAMRGNWNAWLSVDRHMGCGVGACLACVQKIRKDGVEVLVRVCKEGPVFEARDVVWE